ncbi:arylamine N-acetyltransferase family protein [Streptomyces fumanus]|uniref:N-hydroxyarylamine O-acetyltransferase n=1 Tax=Streptomyces fumanus TaxID=67302 RepID=A0A919E8Y1_9ACTN|nr:arylamine N-acetyltransferase [Streptomyces fumanus]GHF26346.1 N-hydroxyarylamine O-acetyltransferase [Streptomyces fumanus]
MADSTRETPFDLDGYCERIGWRGPRRADADTLRGLHLAHLRAIPFENLDALAGRAPSLRLADLTAKLVRGRRGGYCYEHNTLFARVLRELGYGVTLLAARVVVGAERIEDRPRTHSALLVEVPGTAEPYLADVGFGSIGSLLEAVPLRADTEFHDAGRRHRLVRPPHPGPLETWLLQAHLDGGWQGQYAFTLEPFTASDYEVFNWHVATDPRSPFNRRPYLQRLVPGGHLSLDGDRIVETRDDGTVTERKLTGDDEARRVVEEEFGLDVPAGLVPLRAARAS